MQRHILVLLARLFEPDRDFQFHRLTPAELECMPTGSLNMVMIKSIARAEERPMSGMNEVSHHVPFTSDSNLVSGLHVNAALGGGRVIG